MDYENDDPNCASCDGWEGNHEAACTCHPANREEARWAALLARAEAAEAEVARLREVVRAYLATAGDPRGPERLADIDAAARAALAGQGGAA